MAMESPDIPVSLWYVGQVNVVVPHTPETGQDLSEGRHYQVLCLWLDFPLVCSHNQFWSLQLDFLMKCISH